MTTPRLVIVNDYVLLSSADAFRAAIAALAARVRDEGHKGVRSYLFYARPEDATARAIIHYADPDAWIGHHELSFGWPEMKALHGVARLAQVTFHGEITGAIRDWMARAGLAVPVLHYPDFAAGFLRPD
jgi:hypothetical protein